MEEGNAMSAVREYLEVQIREAAQKSLGLPVQSVQLDGETLTLKLVLNGQSEEQPFWRAVKEAYD